MSDPFLAVGHAALAPLSWVYEVAVRARNRRFDRVGATWRAGVPVVSVGNLVVGGTGKTPIVAWLAARLLADGTRPAIVSRGYGGRAGRGPLLVSSGGGPQCSASLSGDEPYLLAQRVPGAIVVVGADRYAGAELARRSGASVVLLDDGFQHRRLARDLDIVLLDAVRPLGNGRLLPRGPLREPVDALRRADVVVATRADTSFDPAEIRRIVAAHRPGIAVVRSSHRRIGFVDLDGRMVHAPRRAAAFSGIARPAAFRADLEAEGVEVVTARTFTDHHAYTTREMIALCDAARASGTQLVTTEKDLARLSGALLPRDAEAPIALRIEAVIHDPEPLVDAVARALARRAA